MKKILATGKSSLLIVFASTAVIISSCTKQGVEPSAALQPNSSQVDEVVAPLAAPAPGFYQVALYVDNGDTSTADFNGYVFNFKANGTLTAKVAQVTYTGKWVSKDSGKELKIDITGTSALLEIDKSWNVVKITNALINLNDINRETNEKDVLVFTRLK